MKKYVALFLVVLMAVSVVSAAGVITTEKANAAPNRDKFYTVQVGKNAAWTANKWNDHDVLSDIPAGWSCPAHAESITGNKLVSTVTVSPADEYGGITTLNGAFVGVTFHVDLGGRAWSDVQNLPVKVRTSVSYDLVGGAQGTLWAESLLRLDSGGNLYTIASSGTTGEHVTGTMTYETQPVPLSSIVNPWQSDTPTGYMIVRLDNLAWFDGPGNTADTVHADGRVTVSNLQLQWV